MKHLCYILLMLMFVACAPSLPSGILDQDEMEDILYDMHVVQGMYNTRSGITDEQGLMAARAAVLRKYDVDQAQWDSSFLYYCRNSNELYKVYYNLNERINRNVVALGGKVDGVQGADADTANVWKGESSFILMQQAPYNYMAFEVLPDSTFEDGDRISLQFDSKMIFQDGYRDVVSYLIVYYDNDSVATNVAHTNMDGHGIVTVNNDVDRLHVRKIGGYMMLNQNLTQNTSNQNTTTMRLASIRNVKLLHLHTAPPAPMTKEEPKDSLNRDSLMKDSIIKSQVSVVNRF